MRSAGQCQALRVDDSGMPILARDLDIGGLQARIGAGTASARRSASCAAIDRHMVDEAAPRTHRRHARKGVFVTCRSSHGGRFAVSSLSPRSWPWRSFSVFEPVEVDEREQQGLVVTPGPGQRALQAIHQQHAVWQAGG